MSDTHVLVVGASGLLGSNVLEVARGRNYAVTGTYHSNRPEFDVDTRRCDITDHNELRALVDQVSPDVVVNCAAMTDVDECERRPDVARAVNAEAPGMLAQLCADHDVRFVHVSTDYVFDGERRERYAEDDSPGPIQTYGVTKLAGERQVTDAMNDALVLRLSFVYGIHRSDGGLDGFPAWVRDQVREGSEVPLFTDQYVTPSRAGHVADTVFELLEGGASGLVHVASRSCVTPYEFGEAIAETMGVSPTFAESSQHDLDREAPRPTYTCLDVQCVEELLGRSEPTLREDLGALSHVF